MMPDIPTISPTDLASLISSQASICLLDVREDVERDICTISYENQMHIPLQELEQRYSKDLNPDIPIVVYCRSGQRSAYATQFLIQQGFINVKNLEGGTLAWGKQIDPKCVPY